MTGRFFKKKIVHLAGAFFFVASSSLGAVGDLFEFGAALFEPTCRTVDLFYFPERDSDIPSWQVVHDYLGTLQWRYLEGEGSLIPSQFSAVHLEGIQDLKAFTAALDSPATGKLAAQVEKLERSIFEKKEFDPRDLLLLSREIQRAEKRRDFPSGGKKETAEDWVRFHYEQAANHAGLFFFPFLRRLSVRWLNDLTPYPIYRENEPARVFTERGGRDERLFALGRTLRYRSPSAFSAFKKELARRAGLYAAFRNWVGAEKELFLRKEYELLWHLIFSVEGRVAFEARAIAAFLTDVNYSMTRSEVSKRAWDRLQQWASKANPGPAILILP